MKHFRAFMMCSFENNVKKLEGFRNEAFPLMSILYTLCQVLAGSIRFMAAIGTGWV